MLLGSWQLPASAAALLLALAAFTGAAATPCDILRGRVAVVIHSTFAGFKRCVLPIAGSKCGLVWAGRGKRVPVARCTACWLCKWAGSCSNRRPPSASAEPPLGEP